MRKKIRILLLTTTGVLGGAEKNLLQWVTKLDSSRYSAAVCTMKDEGLLLKSLRGYAQTYSLGIKNKLEFWKASRLSSIIRKTRPHIILSFLDYDNFLARIFGRLQGCVVINGQHNWEPYRAKWRDLLDRLTKRSTDFYIANNYAGKKLLLDRHLFDFSGKVFVVPNGISIPQDIRKQNIEQASPIFRIISVGRLTEQKNFFTLLKALKGIDNVELTILGEGHLRHSLETEAARLGVRLKLPGFVTDVLQRMVNSDLFVLPSLWEGLPNVVMEAMSVGLPVISSRVSDVPLLISDGKEGLLFSPKNAAELKKKIMLLKKDPELRNRLAKNALEKIAEYSPERAQEAFEQAMEKIVKIKHLDK